MQVSCKYFSFDHGTMHDEYHNPIVKMQSPVNPQIVEIVLDMLDHQCDDVVIAFLLALRRNLSSKDFGVSSVRLIFSM